MVRIDGNSLTITDVVNVSQNYEKVELASHSVGQINESRACVDELTKSNKAIYGITTGFGHLAHKFIPPEDLEKLQINLVKSHSVGVGKPFDEDVVRGIIVLRANALAKGFSGVRKRVITTLLELLNKRIYPYIPCQGSVGASGDLAPLAHLALALIGEGECIVDGRSVDSRYVLDEAGITPLKLKSKEGLGLINGTQAMASMGCLTVHQAELLMKNAQIAGAMSLEALKGTAKVFDHKIHELRAHPGQIKCAKNMRDLIAGSGIIKSHQDCDRIQDAYTLRCIPQVFGAVLDTIDHVKKVLSIEINSVTDNPLIFSKEQEAISGGNFHGEPLAFVMDFLGIALSEIANISERTIDRLVNPLTSGLPAFLSENNGVNSGFMIAQYTAASLVSENKVLAHPSSVDSIPTSAGQEDHVSMGTTAARHAVDITVNVQNVLAIEMLVAAQGIDFCEQNSGRGSSAAHSCIRKHVKHLDEDRILYKEIDTVKRLVATGQIVEAVEEVVDLL